MSTQTLSPTPAYHWTGPNQRRFLETLSETGVVSMAADAVSMSMQAAYSFRKRAAGAAFALGWAAAVLVVRDRLVDTLLERAFMGQEEELIRDPDNNRMVRTRTDNRLGLALLTRLDRMMDEADRCGTDVQMARIVAGDFERYLDLVEREGGGAEAGLFLATHASARSGQAGNSVFHYQLSQISEASVVEEAEETAPEPPTNEPDHGPEHEASFLKVWWDDPYDGWRTDFPPPADFDGEQEGRYGEDGYVRALSDEEAEIYEARLAMENRPFVAAAQDARDAWFAVDADVQAELDQRAAAAEREKSEAEANRRADEAARANALACKDMERLAGPAPLSEPTETKSATGDIADNLAVDDGCVYPAPRPSTFRPVKMRPPPVYGQGGGIAPWAQPIR